MLSGEPYVKPTEEDLQTLVSIWLFPRPPEFQSLPLFLSFILFFKPETHIDTLYLLIQIFSHRLNFSRGIAAFGNNTFPAMMSPVSSLCYFCRLRSYQKHIHSQAYFQISRCTHFLYHNLLQR